MARAFGPALGSCAAGFSLLAMGCGGGVPLLHGAHALSPGSTLTAVGFSGTFTAGGTRAAVEAARATDATTAGSTGALAEESAVIAALAPAVAPFFAMRIGVAGDNELGFSYTGRSLRFDARHAFENGPWAFSLGAGARGTWNASNPGAESASTSSPPSARAYGFDVPLLVGWRSAAGVVSMWGGARGGFDWVHASGSESAGAGGLDLTHWRAGGVAGLSVGFRHLHAAIELETAYHNIAGSGGVQVRGLSFTPAGGVLFTF